MVAWLLVLAVGAGILLIFGPLAGWIVIGLVILLGWLGFILFGG
jgi:hypothetical protein